MIKKAFLALLVLTSLSISYTKGSKILKFAVIPPICQESSTVLPPRIKVVAQFVSEPSKNFISIYYCNSAQDIIAFKSTIEFLLHNIQIRANDLFPRDYENKVRKRLLELLDFKLQDQEITVSFKLNSTVAYFTMYSNHKVVDAYNVSWPCIE